MDRRDYYELLERRVERIERALQINERKTCISGKRRTPRNELFGIGSASESALKSFVRQICIEQSKLEKWLDFKVEKPTTGGHSYMITVTPKRSFDSKSDWFARIIAKTDKSKDMTCPVYRKDLSRDPMSSLRNIDINDKSEARRVADFLLKKVRDAYPSLMFK